MRSKKRNIFFSVICFVFSLMLVACGNQQTEKTLVEQIDEQLTGTWISNDSETVVSKWTFFDGKYVVDTYVNGKKLDNSTVGTYSIGTESIHTVTTDQKKNVEGSIPFTFKDGELVLHGVNGDLRKED